MSAQKHPFAFTLDEYFALERASERRFEFNDGEIVCMSGGSREHAAISRNVVRHLSNKLGGRCQAYGSDLAVYVPDGPPYRYPDASAVCGAESFREINGLDALENPVLLVEVLSPSSADFDRGTKFEWYKSIPTFEEYLLVAQDRPRVARRTRQADGSWNETIHVSLEDRVALHSLGVEIEMREIYEGVAFQERSEEAGR